MSYFEREAKAQRGNGVSINEISRTLNCKLKRVERALQGDHVVRVVMVYEGNPHDIFEFLECVPGGTLFQFHRRSDGSICFDVLPPHDIPDSKVWAARVAADLVLKAINAVVAPRWADDVG